MGATNLEVSPSGQEPRKEREGSSEEMGPRKACRERFAWTGFGSFAGMLWKAQVGCCHLLFSFLKCLDVVGISKGLFDLQTRFLF